ncbi:MAG: SoxR reducing system RseC family protein [Nitrospirae bacterium]|nr:SoxR reducing system RseC family protein [Nitrospirota bacterium]MCL5977750.1 SoxR reducing system RseC family protein [Nitrospirota bacterium]
MKPSIPEIGTVIKLQGDVATVMLKGGESCKGCGQAKIGLCKAGSTNMMLTVKNHLGAKVGDSVTVGVDRGTKAKGYFLAFIIPLFSLIFGALLGHVLGKYFSMPSLEVAAGFATFFLISFFSLRRLKILDSSSSMAIKSVVSGSIFSEYIEADEFRGYSDCQNRL